MSCCLTVLSGRRFSHSLSVSPPVEQVNVKLYPGKLPNCNSHMAMFLPPVGNSYVFVTVNLLQSKLINGAYVPSLVQNDGGNPYSVFVSHVKLTFAFC